MSSQQSSAALTGALLANKGAAAPSNSVSAFLEEFPVARHVARASADAAATGDPETVCRINSSSEMPLDGMDAGSKARAKLSVRLDPDRHLKLKLAAAHLRRSSQAIMLEALDAYLMTVAPALDANCACLGDDA